MDDSASTNTSTSDGTDQPVVSFSDQAPPPPVVNDDIVTSTSPRSSGDDVITAPVTISSSSTDDASQATPSSAPVSGPSKESQVPHFSDQVTGATQPNYAEADKVAKAEGDEYWENYAREIELEKSVIDLGGIEKVSSGEVPIPAEVAKEMGINPTVTIHTPMQDATGFSVGGVTLSDDQVATGLKKPTGTGFRWLAEWFLFQLLKAHYHVKRVGGKLIRGKPSDEPLSS